MITLENIDIMRVLPKWMQEDETAKGIAYAINNQMRKCIPKIALCKLYTDIDNLPANLLDELAWQFSVIEYNSDYSLEVKRALIKSCIDTHRKRGTVAAVEKIVADVFGTGRVEEWFDYDGDAYKYKIYTDNISVQDEMVAEFERIVATAQNVRSELEAVIIETSAAMDLYFAQYLQTTDYMTLT